MAVITLVYLDLAVGLGSRIRFTQLFLEEDYILGWKIFLHSCKDWQTNEKGGVCVGDKICGVWCREREKYLSLSANLQKKL